MVFTFRLLGNRSGGLTFHCPFLEYERLNRRIPVIVTYLSEEENEDERIYGQSETF